MAAKKTRSTRRLDDPTQIAIRVDDSIKSDADDLIPFVTDQLRSTGFHTGRAATRADVLRVALVRGLDSLKKDRERAR